MCNLDRFKQRIKELCATNGITIKFIHQKLNKGGTYLNDVWRGKTTINESDMNLIASILHTTPEYLCGETDDPVPPGSDWMEKIKKDPVKAELMKKLAELDLETLLKVEQIIDMIKGDD